MIVFVAPDPMPRCRHCGLTMDYWVPGQKSEDAAHDDCDSEAFVNKLLSGIKKPAQGGQETSQG